VSPSPSLYLPRQNGLLQGLHPLTKLALALTTLVGAMGLTELPLVLGIYGLVLTPLAAGSQVLRPFLRASLRALAPFLLSLLIIQGFFYPGKDVLFALGPFRYKAEGIAFALLFSARLLVGLGTALLLLLTTRLDHLMLALTERGLSSRIAYVLVTALQIIPRFQLRGQAIFDAQRSRGLRTEGSLLRRARALMFLIPPLLLSSLMETDARAVALEARGFGRPGPRTSWVILIDSGGQRLVRAACGLAALGIIVVRLAGALLPR